MKPRVDFRQSQEHGEEKTGTHKTEKSRTKNPLGGRFLISASGKLSIGRSKEKRGKSIEGGGERSQVSWRKRNLRVRVGWATLPYSKKTPTPARQMLRKKNYPTAEKREEATTGRPCTKKSGSPPGGLVQKYRLIHWEE